MEKYTIISFIGEGSFGRVFKVVEKETKSTFALKVIRKKGRSSRDLKNLRQECDIQQHLRHPNIIRMIESFDTETELVVVTEFAEKELHDILGREGCLPEAKAQVLTWDLVSALYYLHSHRVLHRDLKPQNVLIDANGQAKLCDFGLARNMTTGTHVLTSIKGTPLYMAPELIDEKPYDHQADLWSLGCIVYEMMAGQPPFFTTSIVQLVRLIRHRPVQWPSYISPLAISFLQGLLHKDPSLRLSWPEILVHPFVAGHILILPETSPIESPFTLPLSKSQMAAKLLQKERLNSIQKYMPQAVKILERREQMRKAVVTPVVLGEGAPVSDDDSIRAISAISVRESLRTDDEELQPITEVNADLLAHEYNIINQDNLVISNLNTNIAELALQTKQVMPILNETKNTTIEKNITVENKTDKNIPKNVDTEKNKLNNSSELNRRKLSQNLDNFSIRLKSALSNSNTNNKKCSEDNKRQNKNKTFEEFKKLPADGVLSKSVPPTFRQKILQFSREKFGSNSSNRLTKSLKKSFHLSKTDEKIKLPEERRMSEPVPSNISRSIISEKDQEINEKNDKSESDAQDASKKLDDTNSYDGQTFFDDDCNPIEQDEWLAFMRSNMNEIMEGDVESLTQQNIVGMIVSVARHSKAGAEIRGTLAALLSLPMVAPHVSRHTINAILKVYTEVKLVPNLIYAARLLIRQSSSESSEEKMPKLVSELSSDEMLALCRLMELTTQLCLRSVNFVQQLCDAVAILNTAPLMGQFLSLNDESLRIKMNTVTLMIVILHDLPENAELVESILFENEPVDLCLLLFHTNDILKMRMCILIGLLARYCCSALGNYFSNIWTPKERELLEELQQNTNQLLSRAAKSVVKHLSKYQFYKQKEPKAYHKNP